MITHREQIIRSHGVPGPGVEDGELPDVAGLADAQLLLHEAEGGEQEVCLDVVYCR